MGWRWPRTGRRGSKLLIIESNYLVVVQWLNGLGAGFKKSVESGTTRPIRNRLRLHRVDIDTRYETRSGSV